MATLDYDQFFEVQRPDLMPLYREASGLHDLATFAFQFEASTDWRIYYAGLADGLIISLGHLSGLDPLDMREWLGIGCPARIRRCGYFHDLPETLEKDVAALKAYAINAGLLESDHPEGGVA